MKKFIALFFIVSCLASHAALTLVKQEPFVGTGCLTSASPGNNFDSVTGTFTKVRVGPSTSASPAPGWSADIRTSGPATCRATMNLSGSSSQCGMWGTWIRIKTLPPTGGYMSVLQLLNRTASNVVADFVIDPQGVINVTSYNAVGTSPTFTSPAISPNTWVWIAVAWQIESGPNAPYGIRCMSMPLGGSLSIWGSADNLGSADSSLTFSAVNVGLQTNGTGPKARIGCPSLYSMASLSDIAYPSDLIQPVEQPNYWYVNPITGSDTNDGATPATAWQTAAKVTAESQYCGMLDSNATGPGNGDILTIDTSGGPLSIGSTTMTFLTQGLKVQPASGQTYINCQAEEFLSNASFTPTAGLTNTYQTADTQPYIVAWENDKWMWHVKSASFGAAATITNPQNNATINYPSTGAALDAVPGSFYTDGTNLYIHPFGDTNPQTDGKTYTRSINRGNGGAAVSFMAGNYRAIGFYIRKTTMVDSSDNAFAAYCLQDGVALGTALCSSVESCYFAYGDKHCFASTTGITNSSLLVLNTECEQGNPYCAFGGQSPFVSYSDALTADNVHTYRGCTCLARSGLIGSTAGDPVGTGGDIILSHNGAGTGLSFSSITLDNCNFASGSATMGVIANFDITNHTQISQVTTYCPNTNIQETTFTDELVSMEQGATNLTVENCLIKPTFTLNQAPPYYGFAVFGTVVIEGCTFDLSGITGGYYFFQQGIIQRLASMNLTFRNNAYLVPAGENFPLLYNASSSDTLTFDHNAYNLGSGTIIARSFNPESTPTDLTFAQWQSLGHDCSNSSLNADLLLQNEIPQSGSPLINGGVDLGAMTDFTGTSYSHRDTIGAYQGSGAYLAPQSIAGFPPLQAVSTNSQTITLPATTSAGLGITYAVQSGSATVSGNILTLTGTGTTIVLTATQAGDSSNAPLTETETLTVTVPATDTPTMSVWTLLFLGTLLAFSASRTMKTTKHPMARLG